MRKREENFRKCKNYDILMYLDYDIDISVFDLDVLRMNRRGKYGMFMTHNL